MQDDVAITTLDNPYNPFTDFKQWYSYDIQMGYNTCERLASIVNSLPESLTQEENNYFVNEAIDELIKLFIDKKVNRIILTGGEPLKSRNLPIYSPHNC